VETDLPMFSLVTSVMEEGVCFLNLQMRQSWNQMQEHWKAGLKFQVILTNWWC